MRYRIYYNRREDAPWVWSFDQGTQATERLLVGYRLHGVDVRNGQDLDVAGDTAPRVWIEFEAETVRIDAGVARFYGRWTDSGWPVRED